LCGGISQYNEKEVKGPKNYLSLLITSSKMEGFVVFSYKNEYNTAITELSTWLQEGKLKYRVDLRQGLESAPSALLDLFNGTNQGKLAIQVSYNPLQEKPPTTSL